LDVTDGDLLEGGFNQRRRLGSSRRNDPHGHLLGGALAPIPKIERDPVDP